MKDELRNAIKATKQTLRNSDRDEDMITAFEAYKAALENRAYILTLSTLILALIEKNNEARD